MTDDLVTWLRAQLDEDEQVAQRVEPNQAPNQFRVMVTREGSEPFLVVDSARVLAEVDAKRRILDVYQAEVIDVGRTPTQPEWVHGRVPVEAHTVLRLLALPYADRPGYRDEWRP